MSELIRNHLTPKETDRVSEISFIIERLNQIQSDFENKNKIPDGDLRFLVGIGFIKSTNMTQIRDLALKIIVENLTQLDVTRIFLKKMQERSPKKPAPVLG